MRFLKKNWRRLRTYEKIAFSSSAFFGTAIFLLVFLHLNDIRRASLSVCLPLMALLMLSQCVQNWRKNRAPAIACLATAALVAIAYTLVYIL